MDNTTALNACRTHLAQAERWIDVIDLRRVPSAERDVIRAAQHVVAGAHRFVAASADVATLVEAPQPREAEPSKRRGPTPPLDLGSWLRLNPPVGPLVRPEIAATKLDIDQSEMRARIRRGETAIYNLGGNLQRTRDPHAAALDRQGFVDASAVAAYLSVEKKWVYNHMGELPHWTLGSGKAFRLDEIDWYLETFRRRTP